MESLPSCQDLSNLELPNAKNSPPIDFLGNFPYTYYYKFIVMQELENKELIQLTDEQRIEAAELLKLLEDKRKKYGLLSSKLDRVP
jgi:hypothetical protein